MNIGDFVLVYQKVQDVNNSPFKGRVEDVLASSFFISYLNDNGEWVFVRFSKAVCSSKPVSADLDVEVPRIQLKRCKAK